jgi:predicted DNA-binding transcriptional regulator YafY
MKRNLERIHLKTIKRGGKENRLVKIVYELSSENPDKYRLTEPYEFKVAESGELYYWGYDIAKDGIRQFRLSDIASARIMRNHYAPRWDIKV